MCTVIEKPLALVKETTLLVRGRKVVFQEFESPPEGDFVKVCTYDHGLGVDAEYVWVGNKYGEFRRSLQEFTYMTYNGKEVQCDILTIHPRNGGVKKVYFDLSMVMQGLNYDISADGTRKSNRDHWDARAGVIYDKLIAEQGFLVNDDDDESLYKPIMPGINLAFDNSFFCGFTCDKGASKIEDDMQNLLLPFLYFLEDKGFIDKVLNWGHVIGGYIRLDDIFIKPADMPETECVLRTYAYLEGWVRGLS
jgi:hypothetical protein